MLEDVKALIESIGYTVTPQDAWILDFITGKAEDTAKNICNQQTIPERLHRIAVTRAAGEFLLYKKQNGALGENFDLERAVKTVAEGDTSVTYTDETPAKQFDALLTHMLRYGNGELTSFRRVKW